jgi:protein SDA1
VSNPELLHKKDRGRPTEAVLTMQQRGYGEQEVLEAVPGAEVVSLQEDKQEKEQKEDESDESDWEEVVHSSDEEEEPVPEERFSIF